ncbi:translational activator of cytochrome c oxidase 1-like isoform X4 [Gadus macrocephalus]|uniref:translational activator of cytochrome c oxidase 1-like isoform X4 n=1 Tax=Gadus macrocephalus TaxID=80720 RepID=UPI0028CB6064|nr:translational activator of cytochrome c oxidase 1-like isoform X4 [Gadus macrocephalus]
MAGGVVLRGIAHAAPRNLSFTCSSTELRRILLSGPVDQLARSSTTSVPASVPATSVPATSVPASVPATSVPATSVPASVPATSVPASVPATSVPASVPATSVPATSVPATSVPPTSVPATSVPASVLARRTPATSIPTASVLVRCVLARSVPATSVLASALARSVPVRRLHLDTSHCAGHNKWSKVKHIKGPRDEARGKMFMKYGMMIRIAVKEGGPNPDFNATLAQILEQCRGHNMPKASIDAAIKNAEKAKTGTQHTYEARGPGGFALLIEVLTDNNTRTNQEIKHLLKTNGGVLSDGARHTFDRKGVVVAEAGSVSLEEALELAFEAGAEDVREMEEEEERPMLQFICSQAELSSVRAWLESRGGIRIVSSGLEFVSHTPLLLERSQLEAASVLLEALNDCPDVLRVWDNIQAEH